LGEDEKRGRVVDSLTWAGGGEGGRGKGETGVYLICWGETATLSRRGGASRGKLGVERRTTLARL